jgi:hypothetical protein
MRYSRKVTNWNKESEGYGISLKLTGFVDDTCKENPKREGRIL